MNNKDFDLTKQNGDELTKPRFNLMINPSNMGFDRDLTLTNTCMNHEPITNKRWDVTTTSTNTLWIQSHGKRLVMLFTVDVLRTRGQGWQL